MDESRSAPPRTQSAVSYTPTGVFGVSMDGARLRLFGERFTQEYPGRGDALADALFATLATGLASPAADRTLVRARALEKRDGPRRASRAARILEAQAGGFLVSAGAPSCATCLRSARRRHGLRPYRASSPRQRVLLRCLAWITGVVGRFEDQAWWLRATMNDEGGLLVLVPWERRGGCPRCRRGVIPTEVLDLVDPLGGPLLALAMPDANRPERAVPTAYALDVRPIAGPRLVAGEAKSARGGEAVVVGIAEALERHAFFTDAPDVEGVCASDLAPGRVLLPEQIGAYHPSQHARHLVPFPPFDASAPLAWKRARHLATDAEVLAPHDGGTRPSPLWRGTTSGWAAHRTRDGALVHAILELVERDAVLTTWLARLPGHAFDVRGRSLARDLRERGWDVGCFLLATDLRVRVACVRVSAAGAARMPVGATFIGAGAALTTDESVERALAEAAQMRGWIERLDPKPPAVPEGPRDHPVFYLRQGGRRAFDFLLGAAPRRLLADPRAAGGSVLEDLVARLARVGKQVHWYESEAGRGSPLTAVRAIVPGLLPMGFGPTAHLRLGPYRQRLLEITGARRPLPLKRGPHPL